MFQEAKSPVIRHWQTREPGKLVVSFSLNLKAECQGPRAEEMGASAEALNRSSSATPSLLPCSIQALYGLADAH